MGRVQNEKMTQNDEDLTSAEALGQIESLLSLLCSDLLSMSTISDFLSQLKPTKKLSYFAQVSP